MNNENNMHQQHPHHQTDHDHAAIQHQFRQTQTRVNHRRHEIHQTDLQILAVERDFSDHCEAHDVSYRNVHGFETSTFAITSQLDSAHHYLTGAVVGLVVAVIFGCWFAVLTLTTASFAFLLLGSAVVAAIVGIGASLVYRVLLGAKPLAPSKMRYVDIAIGASGVSFFILLAAFLWMRFNSDSWLAQHPSIVMVGLELTALLFAGACDCGYRVYRWSAKLHRRHRNLTDKKAVHENALQEEEATLHDIEARLHDHANHHEAASEHDHSAAAHHDAGVPREGHRNNGTNSRPQEERHDNIHANATA